LPKKCFCLLGIKKKNVFFFSFSFFDEFSSLSQLAFGRKGGGGVAGEGLNFFGGAQTGFFFLRGGEQVFKSFLNVRFGVTLGFFFWGGFNFAVLLSGGGALGGGGGAWGSENNKKGGKKKTVTI